MKNNSLYIYLLGIFMLGACSQSKNDANSSASKENTIEGAGAYADSATVSGPKLVKTADMTFKVKNVQKSSTDISSLAASMQGMVMDHTSESYVEKSKTNPISADSSLLLSSYVTRANMVIRVPSEKIEEFLNSAGKLAVFIDKRNMHIDDKSFDYLEAKMKNENRKTFLKRNKQKNATDDIDDETGILDVQDELSESKVSTMRINDAVKFSTIGLSIYQNNVINREIIANTDLSANQSPFFNRLKNALSYGWFIFIDLVIGLANLWIFIVLGISIWLIIRYFSKKRGKILPVATGA
ncbi:MAG: DUF4349 domain-containing protein [Daejeonella sp.]